MDKRNKRILMSVIGVLVCGISVGIFKRAALGIDPFQCLMSGLDSLLPISFGTMYVFANFILLLFSLFADRHRIGLATFINLFLMGYVTEYVYAFLLRTLPELSLAARFVLLLIGIVTLCLASSFYYVADLGVSTYDAVALIMAENWNIGKFRYCRIGCDLCCVLVGSGLYFLSGGDGKGLLAMVSIGTIITAFLMGPLIEVFNIHVARPFLEGKRS